MSQTTNSSSDDRLNEILADRTGQPIERIAKDADRDFFMSAEEAKAYGLIDEVLLPSSGWDGESEEE